MLVLGVDAAKSGWIAVARGDGKGPTAHHLPTIDALQPLATDADVIAIDIPIGMPTGGAREADVLARAFVCARRSSVFLTPVRGPSKPNTHVGHTSGIRSHGTGISQRLRPRPEDPGVGAMAAVVAVSGV